MCDKKSKEDHKVPEKRIKFVSLRSLRGPHLHLSKCGRGPSGLRNRILSSSKVGTAHKAQSEPSHKKGQRLQFDYGR